MRAISALVSTTSFSASCEARRLLAAPQFAVQHAAAADAEIAVQRAFELRIKLVDCDRGQKSEAAQIHGEQRNVAAADGARGRKQSPVAAQHDHQLQRRAAHLRAARHVRCGRA